MTRSIRLGDASRKIGSGATPRGGKSAYLDAGPFALIRSQNVLNEGFSHGGLAYISDDQARSLDGVAVADGDVLLNITGDSVARVCQVDPSVLPARVNQHVAIIRTDPRVLHARFLRYALVNPEMQETLLSLAMAGATRNALTKRMIEDLRVDCPPLPEQQAIAATLGALDDKIELNRRTCATLEAMARALFRSWFVDFDPVDAKAAGEAPAHMDPATAALFPDRFGENGLPEEWREGALADLAALNPEKWSNRNAPAFVEYVDLSNTKWGVIEAMSSCAWSEAPSRARMVLRAGDTIIGTVRPANGSFALVSQDGMTGSTGFAVLRPFRPADAALVNLAATDPDTIDALANLADGGAYPAVRPEVVAASTVMIAPEAVRNAFARFATPFIDRIESAKIENRTLATLRDALLPKLMSGELRVREAEARVAEVA